MTLAKISQGNRVEESSYKERLIDRGTLRFEASVAGASERYRRGESSHTVHVWWARRPHSAMRALSFACLAPDSASAPGLMTELAVSSPDCSAITRARHEISSFYGRAPRTLDMFGGGGTIPHECALLGAESYSIDSNELSVFLQRCLLDYAQMIEPAILMSQVSKTGNRVLSRLRELTEDLFPARGVVTSYHWSYEICCRHCNYSISLLKRPWLSRRKGKKIGIRISKGIDGDRSEVVAIANSEDDFNSSRWIGRKGDILCPNCSKVNDNVRLEHTTDKLLAVCESPSGRTGKVYRDPRDDEHANAKAIKRRIKQGLEALNCELPTSCPPKWSGIVNPALYGMETHASAYNARQQASIISLIQALTEAHRELGEELGPDAAKTIVGVLSGLIDQSVDWNSRLSMWISQNEQAGRAFCGPGIAMMWDYAETDPVGTGPSNLVAKLGRILKGCESLTKLPSRVEVRQAQAQNLPFATNFFDAIITDPPYYDNLYYGILADYFYCWKQLLLRSVDPELFTQSTTSDAHELVCSKRRSGSAALAHTEYREQLCKALKESHRVLKEGGVLTLIYSHSSFNGWDALLYAFRHSGLEICGVEPLSIERKQRPRAMTSDAVNTCMAFVARKSNRPKEKISSVVLMTRYEKECGKILCGLSEAGWDKQDSAIAAFAFGVGILMNVSSVKECDDKAMMVKFQEWINRSIPEFQVGKRKTL